MNEPKAIEWKQNGNWYEATIGNGLLKLIVKSTNPMYPDGNYMVQVNGATNIREMERFTSIAEAKLWAEHRAHIYAEQMLRELRASETGENIAESEASE